MKVGPRFRRDATLRCAERDTERYGRLGIADLFERAGWTRKVAKLTGLTQLDYNLDFIIKSNAGLEPRFLVVPIGPDRTIGGGVKLTGSNSDTQTLKLTLGPPAQGPTNRGLATGPRGAGPPIAPADEDRLERSKSRNLLESIDDKLRRQNLGN